MQNIKSARKRAKHPIVRAQNFGILAHIAYLCRGKAIRIRSAKQSGSLAEITSPPSQNIVC